jgi:hypothetical protein
MSWLYKLLDPMNMSPWKILLPSYIEKYGGDKILYLKKEGLSQMGRLKMLIILFSSFGGNSSDKIRRISLQNGFNLISDLLSKPSFFKYNILSPPYFSI